MTLPTLDDSRLPTPLDASVLWGGGISSRRDLAAAHALGALRVTHYPTSWPSLDALADALEQAGAGVPGHAAPGTPPTALIQAPEGLAAVYWDRSAIVFRRTSTGALRAPMCAHGAPGAPLPWTTDLLREVLATSWRRADAPPRAADDWLAPMSDSDLVLPWCPAVTAPPALWAARKALLGTLLALLHHVARAHPDPSTLAVGDHFLYDVFHGPWSVRRFSPDDPRGFVDFHGYDIDMIRDPGYDKPFARGNIRWFVGALDALLPMVFPGRLSWQARIEMKGHALWTGQPFFVHSRGDRPFPMPQTPATQHAKMARHQEALGWRRALEEAGIGPLLGAFLDMPDIEDLQKADVVPNA